MHRKNHKRKLAEITHLNEIDVVQLLVGHSQHILDGRNRSDAHYFGLHTHGGEGDQSGQRLEVVLFHGLLRRDYYGRSSVADSLSNEEM